MKENPQRQCASGYLAKIGQKTHPSVDFFELTATIMIMLVLDSPNITIGCEVRVMRDNGGAGVRAHKEYREVCLN